MKQNTPSLTAYRVALMRAAHQVLDTPKILDDPIALRIVGAEGNSEINSKKRKFKTSLQSYLRAIVVARSKFAEDKLLEAFSRGVSQYVILGAGLDTFAYRNSYAYNGMKIFEVDHPATQEWKQQHLKMAQIGIPENVAFVPADFEKQSFIDQLQSAGFRTDQPVFFSWLGVTMYLTRESMMNTLRHIISHSHSDSEIVFDYVVPPSSQSFMRKAVIHLLSKKVTSFGEPWHTFYDTHSLINDLKNIGFAHVDDMNPAEINSRFFMNRSDKLMVGKFGHLINARL